jgi:formylglycine-generating enzyme required for sulfatase activity
VAETKTVTVAARCQTHTSVSAVSTGLAVNVIDSPYTGAMVYIPAGSFLMGNNGSEGYSYSNELPQHWVSLSAYYIGKYAVTRGEYRQFLDAGGYSNPAYWSSDGWSWKVSDSRTEPRYWAALQNWGSPPGSFMQTENHPVVGVSYYESEAFCNWAGGHLATEAQREKAARWTGSSPRVYPWGDTWDQQRCNNWSDSLYPGLQTAPVGSYPSGVSPYGCHDMAGNVWEWCKDWYLSNYYSQTPGGGWINPQGPSSGSYRVLRGSCWGNSGSSDFRCASRNSGAPNGNWGDPYVGFRIARPGG